MWISHAFFTVTDITMHISELLLSDMLTNATFSLAGAAMRSQRLIVFRMVETAKFQSQLSIEWSKIWINSEFLVMLAKILNDKLIFVIVIILD